MDAFVYLSCYEALNLDLSNRFYNSDNGLKMVIAKHRLCLITFVRIKHYIEVENELSDNGFILTGQDDF